MTRRDNHRFLVSFWLTQVVLFLLVSFNYLSIHFLPSDLWTWGYWFMALVGQMALLSFVLAYLVPNIVSLFCPWRPLCVFMAVSLSSLGLIGLLIDSTVYQLYHSHINLMIVQMVLSPAGGQIFHFTMTEWLIAGGLSMLMIAMAAFSARWVIRRQKKRVTHRSATWVIVFYFVCFLNTHMVHAWANAVYFQPILVATEHVPLFYGLIATDFIQRHQLVHIVRRHSAPLQLTSGNYALNYPIHALHMKKVQPMNIMIIGIDTWRYDMLNKKVMPHLSSFSRRAVNFHHHLSGGNATSSGLFSLFYSLPSNYFHAFYKYGLGPVLFTALYQKFYQVGIYESMSTLTPPLYRNVFSQIKGLRMHTPGKDAVARDRQITQDAKKQINSAFAHKKPFFTFLFYDSLHAYTFPSHDFKPPFLPSHRVNRFLLRRGIVKKNLHAANAKRSIKNKQEIRPYWNQYRNAAYYVDALVGDLLNFMKKKGLLKNTIIIITSDHGEEFDDNHMGYWGHNGNFTASQTHVPLIVFWPGKMQKNIDYLTTGYDIVPTLMHDALGVRNPYKDYSIGHNLFHHGSRPYVIMGNYFFHQGIVQPKLKKILVMKNRMYTITDNHARPLPDAQLDMSTYQQAFKQMHRFYQ